MLRRDRPSTFSNDELANSHSPSGVTTATIVASRSSAACAAAWLVAVPAATAGAITGRRRQLLDLAPERGDVGLLAHDRRAHLLDAVEVLLVVLLVALALRLAVVELLLHRRELVFLGLQLAFEDAPGIAVARALGDRIDPGGAAAAVAAGRRRGARLASSA